MKRGGRQLLLLVVSVLFVTLIAGAAAAERLAPNLLKHAAIYLLAPRDRSLAHLHPALRERVERVFLRLRDQGHAPYVLSGWRSPRLQDAIFHLGAVNERMGGARYTRAKGGQSCHNRTVGDTPAASAVDIGGRGAKSTAQKVAFYRALGAAARAEGLEWGGDWRQKNPAWRRYGLGWDPAHLQLARCRRR